MTIDGATEEGFRQRLDAIRSVAEGSCDVADLEPLLVELLSFLRSDDTDRHTVDQLFAELAESWPPGSLEACEFSMRALRRRSFKQALQRQLDTDMDFRIKEQTRRVLEVFEAEWPAGEIYATYRVRPVGE